MPAQGMRTPVKPVYAHLFETLLFGGSIKLSDYDETTDKKRRRTNNAYTTNTSPIMHGRCLRKTSKRRSGA